MKSDVDELFKTTKPSFLQIVSQEARRTPLQAEHKTKSFKKPLIAAVILLIIGGGTVGGYLFFSGSAEEEPARRAVPPAAFFATESSRAISADMKKRNDFVRLLDDSYREEERGGTMKRILMKVTDGPQERYATFTDVASLMRLAIPQNLSSRAGGDAMTFFYYQKEGASPRFGVSSRITDFDRTWRDLLAWESTALGDLRPLFFSEKVEAAITPFEDRTYRNIDWRYQKLSGERDLGIAYTVFPAKNILVIASSKEMMETVINRLFDAR